MTDRFETSQRLALLREIMRRADLSATAKNICWLLLCERMNSQTGKCVCSNTHIANYLGISLATVKRAKLELQGRPPKPGAPAPEQVLVIDRPPAQNEPTKNSEISSYRFLSRFGAQNEPSKPSFGAELKMSRAQNEPRPKAEPPKREIITFSSPEYDDLERYERATGKSFPRDKRGNAIVKGEWRT